jgi:hypothetical protein
MYHHRYLSVFASFGVVLSRRDIERAYERERWRNPGKPAGRIVIRSENELGSSTGPEKRSGLSSALYQQNHSADRQDGPGKWAVWNIVSRFFRRVNWPYVQDFVTRLESERAPDDDYDANRN